MPQVPSYGQRVVETTALPGARYTPDASPASFGAVEPINLDPAIRQLREIEQREQAKADEDAFFEADAKLAAAETFILLDPKTGVLQRKGKNAFSAPEDVKEEWLKRVGEIESTLSTDRQRDAFRRSALNREESLSRRVQEHVGREMDQHAMETAESLITNEIDAAVANLDKTRIEDAIMRITEVTSSEARRNGWSPEETQRAMQHSLSTLHVGVIGKMLDEDQYQRANDYFKEYKKDIRGSEHGKIQKTLEEETLRGEAQRTALRITNEHRDLTAALKAVDAIKEPKLQDAVRDRVKERFNEQEADENEDREDAYLRATNLLDANPGRRVWDVVPPSLKHILSLEQRNALESRASGGPTENDNRAWLDFLELDVQAVAKLSRVQFESQFWTKFDLSHRGRAESHWLESRNAVENGRLSTPELSSTVTFKDQVANTLRRTRLINPEKPISGLNEKEVDMYAAFEDEAARRILHFELTELEGKRKSTSDEKQTIMDTMATEKVFIEKWWTDPEKPIFALNTDEKGRAYIKYDQVPLLERRSLENLLRSKGRRITNDKIQRAYAQVLMNNPNGVAAILEER